jgi:putative transcriptional regulator
MTMGSPRRISFFLKVLIAKYETKTRTNLTYQDLTDATGIATSTLSRIATNKQRRVDLSVLERLCAFFDCELQDLMRLEPPAEG